MDGMMEATEQFNRDSVYTFRRGPNAGMAVKYLGPADRPFEEYVMVGTADGKPFPRDKAGRNTAICLPVDLVYK